MLMVIYEVASSKGFMFIPRLVNCGEVRRRVAKAGESLPRLGLVTGARHAWTRVDDVHMCSETRNLILGYTQDQLQEAIRS